MFVMELLIIIQQFSGGMQASWNVGKSNRAKNRYGNITTCK